MKKFLVNLAVTSAVTLATGAANAAFIEGGVSFAGAGSPTGGSTWGTATGVNFGTNVVSSVTPGTFSGVPLFSTNVTFSPFTFSPSLSPSPIDPLWTFTYAGITFSYVATSVTVVAQTGNFLNLASQGTLKATGYEDTNGYFEFTGQGPVGNFSVSSSSGAVPLPGTLALLGLGLFGAARVSRRSMKQA